MSFKGVVEGRCPKGCETEEVEAWSFVRGDANPELREVLLAGELNLVLCGNCGEPYYAEAVVIYLDEKAGLLAFIFPESYRSDETRWRGKMEEDFAQLRAAMPDLQVARPRVYFGFEEIRRDLQADDDMGDEVEVAHFFDEKLGLEIHAVDRAFARERNLPWEVPLGRGKAFTRENALEAVSSLLKVNDSLQGYGRWKSFLEGAEKLPVSAKVPSRRK